jgi:hypothetical protein
MAESHVVKTQTYVREMTVTYALTVDLKYRVMIVASVQTVVKATVNQSLFNH